MRFSFKYAFNGKSNGIINIHFNNIKEDGFKLIVSDDGIGIPDHIDITKTKSLGMKILHKLVQQIEGELQSDFSEGTKFTITFKTFN